MLVVDDNATSRAIASEMLRAQGCARIAKPIRAPRA